MPERDYDRLEQFFRKASAKADVTFNEDDWKKLEDRLDAQDAAKTSGRKTGGRVAATVVTAILLTVSTAIWVSSNYGDDVPGNTTGETLVQMEGPESNPPRQQSAPANPEANASSENETNSERGETSETQQLSSLLETVIGSPSRQPAVSPDESNGNERVAADRIAQSDALPGNQRESMADTDRLSTPTPANEGLSEEKHPASELPIEENVSAGDNDQYAQSLQTMEDRLTKVGPDSMERNKQKAVVELPGAEEEETREAQAVVQKEHASEKEKHVATPRLSLLLSFAPDFSGTSIGLSSTPGKAFGAMLHYHPFERWSISAGAVKNHKQYTGSGEYYKPPKGYWTRYTNGVIPETIDGACDILEFPLMIQYTPILQNKSRWNVGAGVSSYLMQSESYQYHFDQPNPGARDSWDSRGSDRFMFNMMIFTVGYERQILPGLMLGIEPYAKIPLEEIGWCNLKLFSSGASFTLRYTILGRTRLSVPTRSRGPD